MTVSSWTGFDVASGIKRGGVSVIPWQVLKMFKNRATYIAQGELFAPFLAILTNLKDATGQHLLVFCDNLGILSSAVSGRFSVLDVNSLLTCLHLLLTNLRVTSWWEHVDTHANPAGGGSRQGTSCKLAIRLGIPLEWFFLKKKIPFVPACMAAAGPTEWLKFFFFAHGSWYSSRHNSSDPESETRPINYSIVLLVHGCDTNPGHTLNACSCQ